MKYPFPYLPYWNTPIPIGVPNEENNIYYRTCKQLHDYLIDNDFAECQVSRASIGDTEYYNIQFDVPTSCDHSQIDYHRMKKLLHIENIGLMDFSTIKKECGSIHHIVVVIDEKELNDKYLVDGNLIFNDFEREIKKLIAKSIQFPTEITHECDSTTFVWNKEEIASNIYNQLKEEGYLR